MPIVGQHADDKLALLEIIVVSTCCGFWVLRLRGVVWYNKTNMTSLWGG